MSVCVAADGRPRDGERDGASFRARLDVSATSVCFFRNERDRVGGDIVDYRRCYGQKGWRMSFSVEGDYFEVCTCDVSCPCIWLRPADKEACDLMLAWHVKEGQKDGVDLSGMNAVMAVHSPKQMTDGGWKVALYLDDRATAEQSEALGAVFSGAAGGHLAAVAPLIGEVAGVAPATITFDRDNGSLNASVSGALSMQAEEIKGMDGATAPVITNPLLGAITQPVTQAKSKDVSYHGHWDVEYSGTNSFVTDFKYEG